METERGEGTERFTGQSSGPSAVGSQLLLAAVAVLMLAAGAYLNGWLSGPQRETPFRFRVPTQVAGWKAVSEDRLRFGWEVILEPTSYALRRYAAPDRRPVHLYVAFYASRAATAKGAHDPEICYPSSGWDQVGAEAVELFAAGTDGSADAFQAKLLDMRNGSANELVLYWFQPAERWPAGELWEEFLYLYDAVAGRPQYAFVRLVGVVEDPSERDAVRADLEDFASALAWPVRSALRSREPQALATSRGWSAGDAGSREQTGRVLPAGEARYEGAQLPLAQTSVDG